MGVSLQFSIDGREFIAPKEWKDLKETLIYGKGTTEATIESESLSFVGDAMLYIKSLYDNGQILRPIDFEAVMIQNGVRTTFFENYVIDLTLGIQFELPQFGALDVPLSVKCKIRRKLGFDTFIQEIQGVSFSYLESEGYVTSSNYSDVKVTVIKPNMGREISLALLSLVTLQLQLKKFVDDATELAIDIQQRAVSSAISSVSTVIYSIVIITLRVISLAVQGALILKIFNNINRLLAPPLVTDKGMTWRNLVEGIIRGYNDNLNAYNVTLDCDLDEFDSEVLLPSNPHNNSLKLTEKVREAIFPYYAPNTKGIPNTSDSWHLGGGLFELIKKRFNAVFYFDNSVLKIRTKGDSRLYVVNSYTSAINPLLETGVPNITEIPQTRVISFATDSNDEWTLENFKGTSYEVKNVSKYTRLKGLESIDLPIALGSVKTKLAPLEIVLLQVAKVVDLIGKFVGIKSNQQQKLKGNRLNILKTSERYISVGKLLPISNGNMATNPTDTTSARMIENKYYYNESIKRGNGQKIKYSNVKVPFSLADRNKIRNNNLFIDSNGNTATFESIDWTFAKDEAILNYYVNSDYIADNDIEEILIEPE